MAQAILADFSQNVSSLELIPGTGGRYEVSIDGELVFSKEATGRYPEVSEIEDKIKARL